MATYVPVATDPADPVSSRFVGSAAEEFRTLKNRTKGALVVPLTDPVPGFIPAVATRAGKVLGFDASGNPVVLSVAGTTDPSLRADLAAAGGVALVNGAVSQADLQKQTYIAGTTGGTSTAYTFTANPAITAYLANESFFLTFHAVSGDNPTLAINGVATPPNLVKQNRDGTYSNILAGDITLNHRSRVALLSATQAWVETLPVRGVIVDRAYAEYTANANITTVIPFDDTIPQNTEGTQILSVVITPKSTTNRLRIRFQGQYTCTTASNGIVAIFTSASANAIAVDTSSVTGLDFAGQLVSEVEIVPGSITPLTVSARIGPNTANTLRLNGTTSARLFGGSMKATLVVEEITP